MFGRDIRLVQPTAGGSLGWLQAVAILTLLGCPASLLALYPRAGSKPGLHRRWRWRRVRLPPGVCCHSLRYWFWVWTNRWSLLFAIVIANVLYGMSVGIAVRWIHRIS
jgi:hypothetical protein